jgi:hypothetical protein
MNEQWRLWWGGVAFGMCLSTAVFITARVVFYVWAGR